MDEGIAKAINEDNGLSLRAWADQLEEQGEEYKAQIVRWMIRWHRRPRLATQFRRISKIDHRYKVTRWYCWLFRHIGDAPTTKDQVQSRPEHSVPYDKRVSFGRAQTTLAASYRKALDIMVASVEKGSFDWSK